MNKTTGAICYEAMQPEQNAKIQQRIYELKVLGTMYYSSGTIQNHLRDIYFVPKSENMAGLQLADFVPNTLGRYAAMMKPKIGNFQGVSGISCMTGMVTKDLALRFWHKIFYR